MAEQTGILTEAEAAEMREQVRRYKSMADEADRMIRERYDGGYEVLYRAEDMTFVVAAPADDSEGGDPDQPTAICCGFCDDFGDAEQLYEAALRYTDEVDKLFARACRSDED